MTPLLRHLGWAALAALLVLALSLLLGPFRNFELATVAAYFCAAAGLTVLTGLSGQLSLGQGAFMAVGAYAATGTSQLLADRTWAVGLSEVVPVLAGALAAGVVGLVIGVAAARLRGPYLAGVTLALAIAVPSVASLFDGLLGGDQGLTYAAEPPPAIGGRAVPVEQWQVWVSWAVALLVAVGLANLSRSRLGRTLRAIRDDESAAALAGVDVARARATVFGVSSVAAGAGGALVAWQTQIAAPGAYPLTLSLSLLIAVVIGGLGRLSGAAVGAALLVLLPDLAQSLTDALDLSAEQAQRWQGTLPQLLFGVVVILVVLVAPQGLHGLSERAVQRARKLSSPRPIPSHERQSER
ncbi:branched-chain amino acid ABC transporter permease [Angustibacter luteus]|uniref:Branched-chain amino acid ABC transporter permease n=1 Tax=Angustibacter luteus TaxID=658456 RepID=A0ABW1JJE6_9ACTN